MQLPAQANDFSDTHGLMPEPVCFQELDGMASTAPMCATDWVSVLQADQRVSTSDLAQGTASL